jgi:hypothetical protein
MAHAKHDIMSDVHPAANTTGPVILTQLTQELMTGADQLAITRHTPAVISANPTNTSANAALMVAQDVVTLSVITTTATTTLVTVSWKANDDDDSSSSSSSSPIDGTLRLRNRHQQIVADYTELCDVQKTSSDYIADAVLLYNNYYTITIYSS